MNAQTMGLGMNQFKQKEVAGMVALEAIEGRTLQVKLADSVTGEVAPGTPVVLQATSTGMDIIVAPKAAATDKEIGVVAYNFKKTSYKAGDYLDIYVSGKVIFANIGAAVNAGADLSWDLTNKKFIATAGGAAVDAIAFDKANANTIGRIVVKGIMG